MFGLAQVDRLNGDVCLFMTDITHAMGDVRNTELQLYFVTSATGDGHGAVRTANVIPNYFIRIPNRTSCTALRIDTYHHLKKLRLGPEWTVDFLKPSQLVHKSRGDTTVTEAITSRL